MLHEPPDGVWKLVRYLLLSGGISVGIGIIGVALGMRFLPRVSLKVGLGYAVASVGAIITILYTPLLMFKQVQDLHLLALLLVSFLVISFGMAAIIGLHMAERVRTLRWAAQEIAAGHFGTHVIVSWRDELSDLAAAFNRMSEEVERVFAHERAMEQERRDLVVAISHDLRTPLTGMRVMLEAIQDGIAADPETVADYHSRMHGEIDHLTHLSDDLFELSRLESGAPLEVARIDLRELVRDSAESVALLAERHGLTLEVHLPSASETVNADPRQLQRVLANLLHNALRHTKPGGRISIASHGDAGGLPSRLPTRGRVSPAKTFRTSSIGFIGQRNRVRATPMAQGSAWQSPGRSSRPTVATFAPKAPLGKGRDSSSRSPSMGPHQCIQDRSRRVRLFDHSEPCRSRSREARHEGPGHMPRVGPGRNVVRPASSVSG